MLERLELNYFKRHEHLVVNFTDGLNGVVGPNYRGKSTILYGILYCLGGARLVPGTRLQTRGTNSGFRQVLWFAIAGQGRYRVERTKTGATLTELCPNGDEQPVATGTTPVNQVIARLIGMPLKRFAQIKYAKQGQVAAILRYGSTELFAIITELTGLGRVSSVLERVSSQLKTWRQVQDETPLTDLSEQHAQLRQWLAEEEDLMGQAAGLGVTLGQLQRERGDAAEQERKLSAAQTAVFSATTSLRHAERELEDVRASLAEAERKLTEFRGEPKEAGELADLEWQLKALREQAQQARLAHSQARQIQRELDEEQLRLDTAKKLAEPLRERQAKAREVMAEFDLPALRESHATAKAAVQTHSDKLQQLIEAGKSGVCEGCLRPFEDFNPEDHAAHVLQQQLVVREQRGHADTWQRALRAGEQAQEHLLEAEGAWQRADQQVHSLMQSCNHLTENLGTAARSARELPNPDQLGPQIEALEASIATGRHDAQRRAALEAAHITERQRWAAREQGHKQAIDELQRLRQEHLVQDIDLVMALSEARSRTTRLDSELRRITEQQGELRSQAHAVREQRAALERSLEAAAERNRQHEQAATRVRLLSELQGHIRSNRDRYSKQVWDVFMASASLFASSATGGVIESITRSEDGAFSFVEDGFEMEQAEGSGAQLAIIGTAVQLALADAAQSPLNIVLMDEPTADMDPERALAFSTLLASSGKQVIMVTHRELDSTVFDNSVEL